MIIKSIAETSYSGMFKLAPTEGPAFFIRKEYLSHVDFDSIEPGVEFLDDAENELLDAGLASVVELKAVDYLARAEQSRFGLRNKLIQKEYDKKYIDMALNLLEAKNYLNDLRFSGAWLRTRKINHYEGRTRLLSELLSRGISRETALQAINEFFEENNELDICIKAYERFVKKGKSDDKLVSAMLAAGFSYKLIKEAQVSYTSSI